MPQLTEELIRKRPGLDPFVGTVQHGRLQRRRLRVFCLKKLGLINIDITVVENTKKN